MLDKKFSHEGGRAKPADGDEGDEGDEMKGIVLAYTQRQRGCVANFDS